VSDLAFRAPAPGDGARLRAFFAEVPDWEQRFLKEDVRDADALVAAWLADPRGRWILAADGEAIVGLACALPQGGWSSHVAELRVIVAPSHRGRGLGRELARRALVTALELGCTHVYVEVVAEQEQLVAMFGDMGFEPEALLRDFVRDSNGEPHDLMLLTHRAEEQWARMEALGVDEASV
jgi:RimJ/RimL family protein N-acetyltransferase